MKGSRDGGEKRKMEMYVDMGRGLEKIARPGSRSALLGCSVCRVRELDDRG